MIEAAFHRNGDCWLGFVISGHAGLAESGYDIVCAAVSALSQGAIIGLEQVVGVETETEIDDSGFLRCFLPPGLTPDKLHEAQIILQTLYLSLKSIEMGYGDALQVLEKP